MTKRSLSELKRLSRECLLNRYTIVIMAMLVSFFLPAVLMIPFSVEITGELNAAVMIYLIAAVIIQILRQLLYVSVLRMHLLLALKQPVVFGDLLWSFKNRPDRFILATVLLYAVLFLPMLFAGAAVYFFIPDAMPARIVFLVAVIVVFIAAQLYLRYVFALVYPLYLEHPEMTVLDGFQASRRLMHGNKKRMFFLQLSFIGWELLGFCSAGVGFLWISPYMTQTKVNFYLDLTGGLHS